MIKEMTDEAYHADPALGRSGAWTLWKKTPAHYKYGERPTSKPQAFGKMIHHAILQPTLFTQLYRPAENLDRRTKQGQAFVALCEEAGQVPVKLTEYDEARRIRDAALRHPIVELMLKDAKVELAGFAPDDEFPAVKLKCKPDIYSPGMRLLADIKSAQSAGSFEFGKAAGSYGYHLQEPWYSKVWTAAGGGQVDGFVFIVVEKEAPHLVNVLELEPSDYEEGMAVMRRAVRIFAECQEKDEWLGYPTTVTRLSLPRWAITETAGEEL